MKDVNEIKWTEGDQFVLVNSSGFKITIPFECFSSDYARIAGSVTTTVKVHEPVRAIRLIRESPLSLSDGLVEFSDSDLVAMVRGNVQYTIRTECASLFDNSDENEICKIITNKLNHISGYWIEYGLLVNFESTEVSEAVYTEAFNAMKQAEARALARDLEIMEARRAAEQTMEIHNIEANAKRLMEIADIQDRLTIDLQLMRSQEEKDDLARQIAEDKALKQTKYAQQLQELEKAHQYKMQLLQKNAEISDKEKELKLALLQKQLDQIDLEKRKSETELELMKIQAEHEHSLDTIRVAGDLAAKVAGTAGISDGLSVIINKTKGAQVCSKCGVKASSESARFCRICGNKLAERNHSGFEATILRYPQTSIS